MSNFCHLHVHTEYSLLDGAARINRLVPRAKELGFKHLAMTDHGVMYGTVEFYKECLKQGIHPVLGCEVYVCENMEDKQGRLNGAPMRTGEPRRAGEYAHLLLLCENNRGYENLIYLVSQGFLRGYYYKPRIDYKLLSEHSEGLICCSACLSGDIPRLLLGGQYAAAKAKALELQQMFGAGNFFIELMDHGIRDERLVLGQLAQLAGELGIPMVATNDVHYIDRADANAQDVLMCIQTGKFLSDTDRMKLEGEELYLKSEDEMRRLLGGYEGALENTVRIAERCNVELDFSTQHLPEFSPPEGYTNEQYLSSLVMLGFAARYGNQPLDAGELKIGATDGAAGAGIDDNTPAESSDLAASDPAASGLHGDENPMARARYELKMISDMGYVDYFLVVWDFIRFAKEKGIPVGPGRGSAAGSVVAYCLGITDIDPIRYGLIFERFLNPERITMPDIDIDFCYERRQEVIDYVIEKYGTDHVAQIITFGTMAARAVIRDVGRVLSMPYGEVDRIAKMIPFAIGMTIEKALNLSRALAQEYQNDMQVRQLIDTARKLEGLPRHAGTHAAGVVISKMPLVEIVPLQTNDDTVTTQFSMGALEELGLLKMDFLGLRNLTIIEQACDIIERDTGTRPDMKAMEMDDPEVYRMISRGDTDGVFQLESGGMRQLLRDLQPTGFEDIIACISLYRPGPMDQIPKYVEGRHHPEKATYMHPSLKPILDVTYGCMVYQEQVMQIVRDIAGYSWARSDLVRRAMSKKKADVMEKERRVFIHGSEDGSVAGAVKNGVSEKMASKIFDQMIDFAQYAFNKSHAAAYGVVAYRTAWLKAKYPVQYMAALMNSHLGSSGKIAQYIAFCRNNDIRVLPPDINKSARKFDVQDGSIRFGLSAVKNVGANAIDEMIKARGNTPFQDFFEFLRRVPLRSINKRMVESLIRAGAFDCFGNKRTQLMAVCDATIDAMLNEERRNVKGQLSMFDSGIMGDAGASNTLPDIKEYPPRAMLAMEKEMTGVYITGHPLMEHRDEFAKLRYTALDILQSTEQGDNLDGKRVVLAGIVSERRPKTTRKNEMMAYYTLEDMDASVNLLAFPRTFEEYDGVMVVDSLVVLKGRVSIREDEEPTIIMDEVRTFEPGAIEEMQSEQSYAMGGDQNYTRRPAPPAKAAEKKPLQTQAEGRRGEELPTYDIIADKRSLWLRMRSFDNDFLMLGLMSTLRQHPGAVCVKAYAVDKGQLMKLKTSVEPDEELLENLRDILGSENIKLVTEQ